MSWPEESSNTRARALLAHYFPTAQEGRTLEVQGDAGGTYQIASDSTVREVCGAYSRHWCLVIQDMNMPPADEILAKALLLRADEAAFRDTAVGGCRFRQPAYGGSA